ncbi:OsmC family protein [Streptomyces sp. NPDC059680]|uniref:OsmC family protein n=1 Tax=unclassified Streptomyces TaxID=2593676 RepID=UPI003451615A
MPAHVVRASWRGAPEDIPPHAASATATAGTRPRRQALSWENDDDQDLPEAMIASAHARSYALQLTELIARAGGVLWSVEVSAEHVLEGDTTGGSQLVRTALLVRVDVAGMDDEQLRRIAAEARAGCVVSKALSGVDNTIDARLGEAPEK